MRPHRAEDFEAYAAMWAEPAVVRFIGGVPFTREAAWSRLLRHPGLWTFLGFGSFAVRKAFPPAQKKAAGPAGPAAFHSSRRSRRRAPAPEGSISRRAG
ncbi:GNAT family N-acetyltransferase [Ancylobacter dichloromethanicus]